MKIMVDFERENNINSNCGTKAESLVVLKHIGLNVPTFYSVSINHFERYCELMNIQCESGFSYFNELPTILNQNVHVGINERYERLLTAEQYIIRSSAVPMNNVDKNLFPSMVSGIFKSFRAKDKKDIPTQIKNVWNSLFSQLESDQQVLLNTKPFIKGMGVVIQEFVNPVISGVLHTYKRPSVSWTEGHLFKIVQGNGVGHSLEIYMNHRNDLILRGLEEDILIVKDQLLIDVFDNLYRISQLIRNHFGTVQEIEWLFDGSKIWVVQTQMLIDKE